MKLTHALLVLALYCTARLLAQNAEDGIITGSVFNKKSGKPVEYATLALKHKTGDKTEQSAISDASGRFVMEAVPYGEYRMVYGTLSTESQQTAYFTVDAAHRQHDLGRLLLAANAVTMARFEVVARQEAFENSIDRKVYNVGLDLQSLSGSTSDLLQNIPSVEVDVEGNVSLRGSENVLILVDGKTSTLMGANRAAVLEQMPADSIEKIEVITNPSAKYKPDGTAGIINIVLKHKREPGYSGSFRASGGNNRRYNTSVTANYNPGKYNLFGSFSLRQDDRPRFYENNRWHVDAATNHVVATDQKTEENSRPLSRIAQTGIDYTLNQQNKFGATVNYNYRTFLRHATEVNVTRDDTGAVTSAYDRTRTDPEFEKDVEFVTTYQHSNPNSGRELNLEFKHGTTTEQEDNSYANFCLTPATATTYDHTLIRNLTKGTEAIAEYVYPIGDDSKLEAGYSREANRNDFDYTGTFLDPLTGTWALDPTKTNRFLFDETIHAVYVTYGRPVGYLGILGGLRAEKSFVDTNQVTTRVVESDDTFRIYPTLHLTYNLTVSHQLQLNYSRRVQRPESDDMNPFPEYQDPYNLKAGNPHLKPEDIHSLEAGYQYRNNDTTYLATAYYRQMYHGFTDVARYIDSTTLLTTKQNLATNRSAGLELAASSNLGRLATLNLSSNVYYNQIDASNLGFSDKKSTIAWSAKLNANVHLSKNTMLQIDTNYKAKRLTPQGYRYPNFVANIGLRHEFPDKNTALLLTVSDVFDSLKERTLVDTSILHEEIIKRKTARVIYVGFIYNFGRPTKKLKDDSLQYDNQL